VTWTTEAGGSVGDSFVGNTKYLAAFTLTPSEGYEFTDTANILLTNGQVAQRTLQQDGSLYVQVSFAETAKADLKSISIETEPKAQYNVGDSFDLTGLVLTLNYTDGSTGTVAYDADTKNITVTPQTMTLGTTSVTFTYAGLTTTMNDVEVTLGTNPATPELTIGNVGKTTIEVYANSGYQYQCQLKGTDPVDGAWQTSGKFINLQPDTDYTVYARIAQTSLYAATEPVSQDVHTTDGKTTITSVSLTINAPTTGAHVMEVNKTATGDDSYDIAVGWLDTSGKEFPNSDEDDDANYVNPEDAVFAEKQEYFVVFTLTPKTEGDVEYAFADAAQITAKVNGQTVPSNSIEGVKKKDDGTLVVTYLFDATDDRTVSSIIVSNWPTKTEYIEGESFNGEGLVLKVFYNNDTSETVAYTAGAFSFSPAVLKVNTADSAIDWNRTVEMTYAGKTIKLDNNEKGYVVYKQMQLSDTQTDGGVQDEGKQTHDMTLQQNALVPATARVKD
jgi:hypothetical protein